MSESKSEQFPFTLSVVSEFKHYATHENALCMVELVGTQEVGLRASETEVVFVLDVSDSMSHVIDTITGCVKHVSKITPDNFNVGIVTFNDQANVYFDMSKMTSNAKQLLSSKSPLVASGLTNIRQALGKGLSLFSSEEKVPGRTRIMIFVSDGKDTTYCVNFDNIIEEFKQKKVSVTSVALGSDVEIELLKKISESTMGRMYHVTSMDNIARVFGECYGTAMSCCSSNLVVKVFMGDQNKDEMSFNVGNLYESEQKNVLFEVPGDVGSFWVQVQGMNAITGKDFLVKKSVTLVRQPVIERQRIRDPDVMAQVIRIEGQKVITRCSQTQTNVGLAELKQKIIENELENNSIGKILLSDIEKLEKVFASLEIEGRTNEVYLMASPVESDYEIRESLPSPSPSSPSLSLSSPSSLSRYPPISYPPASTPTYTRSVTLPFSAACATVGANLYTQATPVGRTTRQVSESFDASSKKQS